MTTAVTVLRSLCSHFYPTMPLLIDIPVEVLLDNLLPLIPVPDLLRLASTNKVCELVMT
jgi:hypothetical protein